MTQKQQYAITRKKVEAYKEYANFCIRHKEMPRKDLILIIDGCNNLDALIELVDIYKSK